MPERVAAKGAASAKLKKTDVDEFRRGRVMASTKFWAKRAGLFRDRPCLLHFEVDGLHVLSPTGSAVDIVAFGGMLTTREGPVAIRVSASKSSMKLIFSAEEIATTFLKSVERCFDVACARHLLWHMNA